MWPRSIRLLAILVSLAPLVEQAHAGGSIALPEVMQLLETEERLIADIEAALDEQDLEADDITCTGARFGNQWRELGGARAIPFLCTIGNRELKIEGTLRLLDGDGRTLDINDPAAPERATNFEQTDLHWSWPPVRERI